MEKPTTKLSAQDRVILLCVATGIQHASVGVNDHAMQSMAIRGFIAHNRESGVYSLTDRPSLALRQAERAVKRTGPVGALLGSGRESTMLDIGRAWARRGIVP